MSAMPSNKNKLFVLSESVITTFMTFLHERSPPLLVHDTGCHDDERLLLPRSGRCLNHLGGQRLTRADTESRVELGHGRLSRRDGLVSFVRAKRNAVFRHA